MTCSDLKHTGVRSYKGVVNQVIAIRKFMLIDNTSCFNKHLIELGIIKIGDIASDKWVGSMEVIRLFVRHLCLPFSVSN